MKLPITAAQRRRIEYRARVAEQNLMIRVMREALYAHGFSGRYVQGFVTDVLNARVTHTKGKER